MLISAEERIELMMPLYNNMRRRMVVPHFPSYGATLPCGMNKTMAEDIVQGVQARCTLYAMTPATGWYEIDIT